MEHIAKLREWIGSSPVAQGYQRIYGTFADPASTPGGGLQVLPPDASKIEPKVFFAHERTFLNWLRVALLLSSFALALFNSSPSGSPGRYMGLVYALIAIGMVAYAWLMHQRRRWWIVTRYSGNHDDLKGPVTVCVLIFFAVLVNFILRVSQREKLRNTPSPKNPWVLTFELVARGLGRNVN